MSLCGMKKRYLLQPLLILALITTPAKDAGAQHKLSFNVAANQDIVKAASGYNMSCFYHFTRHFSGGLELNHFFPKLHRSTKEEFELSANDIDLNFHYDLPLYKKLICYPITGISHTSEKEYNLHNQETVYHRFYSFNTGAGLYLEGYIIMPFVEYSLTVGQLTQQFVLAGISYELDWKHTGHAKNNKPEL